MCFHYTDKQTFFQGRRKEKQQKERNLCQWWSLNKEDQSLTQKTSIVLTRMAVKSYGENRQDEGLKEYAEVSEQKI